MAGGGIAQSRGRRLILGALELAAACAVVAFLIHYGWSVLSSSIPFDTDEADHANASLELYRAISRASLSETIAAIFRQSFYPPLFSFFGAASYALFGLSISSSRLPSLIFLILSMAALSSALGRTLKESDARLSKWLCVFLMLLSPVLLANASLCMLELLGVLGGSLCIAEAADCDNSKRGGWRLGVLGGLVALTKFNFGIMIVPAIIGACLLDSSERSIARRAAACLPALAAFAAVVGVFLVGADLRSVARFFTGHPSYAPLFSAENIFFDVHHWITDYAINPFMGAASLGLAAYGAVSFWRRYEARFAACLALGTLGILLLSTTNEVRHFIIAAPGIWFLACLGFSKLIQSSKLGRVPGFICLVSLALVFIISLYTTSVKVPRLIAKEQEGMPGWSALEEFIALNLGDQEPALISGAFDSFSLESIRWHRAARTSQKYSEVQLDPFPYREDKAISSGYRNRNIDAAFSRPELRSPDLRVTISARHYKSFVLISRAGKLLPEQAAAKKMLMSEPFASSSRDGVRVELFKLPAD